MKIIITTSIFPPDTGGPAHYAKDLSEVLKNMGHEVCVLAYTWERKFPSWIKHLFFSVKILKNIRNVDFVLALDTYLTAVPSWLVGKITSKKVFMRTGGDFLWEMFVNRTGQDVVFSEFYKEGIILSMKEKIIYKITKFTLKRLNAIIFSTRYQKDIFMSAYELNKKKCFIVENSYKDKVPSRAPREKNFLWAGRNIKLKNVDRLKVAFQQAREDNPDISLDIMENPDHQLLMERMKGCYTLILPSLSEISPGIILRAISFNKPFICTKETGIYERIKDIGLFIDPLSIEDIKEKILFLADSINYKGQKKRVESFDFKHSYAQIASEIIEIANKNI